MLLSHLHGSITVISACYKMGFKWTHLLPVSYVTVCIDTVQLGDYLSVMSGGFD